jgi:AcrR family transcriptional regulator
VAKSRGRRLAAEAVTAEELGRIALDQFATVGYARTTIRSVAQAAGVDPALVMYHHGSKRELFLAAVTMRFDPSAVAEELAAGDRASVGRRLADFLLAAWEDPVQRQVFLARIRAAATEPEAAEMVRDLIGRELVVPLVRLLRSDRPEVRAGLVSSQLMGYVVARYLVGVTALDLPPAAAAELLAPTLQRYLVEPL